MKRSVAFALATLPVAFTPALAQKQRPEHVYGPEPSWDEYVRIAEPGVAEKLIDPESARISWITGIYKGEEKTFAGRVAGYWACGSVNAKNRMGGYTGAQTFIVAVDFGRVLYSNQGGSVDDACAKFIRNGKFPPVPAAASSTSAMHVAGAIAASSAPVQQADAATGLTLQAMPDGAYVAAVVSASLAANAGLKPGMVITSVNAVPLAGMGAMMVKVVDAAGPSATLTLVDGKTVKLGGAK